MDYEKKRIRLLINQSESRDIDLLLYDEAPDDYEMVLLKLNIEETTISFKADNFFDALTELRTHLEKKNMQIICNGAAKNVYPSPMQQSMGTGRLAYMTFIGKQAKTVDVVDIFDCAQGLEFVDIDEQSKFYDQWLRSLADG